MKASFIETCGPPTNIQFGDLPDPTPGNGQVLVRMQAVSVNPIDTYIRNGANFWELPQPYIIGSDIAGVVEDVGPNVSNFKIGDRVWGSNQGLLGKQGTFAELCPIDEQWLYPTPKEVDSKTLAAVALVGITAHLGLFSRAHLASGETIFVQGGTGGVGSMVVQMAKATGARVIATVGSSEKVQRCQDLGADHVINYRTENVAETIRELAPRGVDVIWETQRIPNLDLLVDVAAENARIVLMAGRDARPEFPVGPFYVKGCSILGFVMFKNPPETQCAAAHQISQWLVQGNLKAPIGLELPLADAAQAHEIQESATLRRENTLTGKIVLLPP